jgi:hypothetical protein
MESRKVQALLKRLLGGHPIVAIGNLDLLGSGLQGFPEYQLL